MCIIYTEVRIYKFLYLRYRYTLHKYIHTLYIYINYISYIYTEVTKAGSVAARFYDFLCQPRVPERAEAAVLQDPPAPSPPGEPPGPAPVPPELPWPHRAHRARGTPVTYHLHGGLGAPAGSPRLRHRHRPSGRSGRNNHRDGGRSGRKRLCRRRQPRPGPGPGP